MASDLTPDVREAIVLWCEQCADLAGRACLGEHGAFGNVGQRPALLAAVPRLGTGERECVERERKAFVRGCRYAGVMRITEHWPVVLELFPDPSPAPASPEPVGGR